MSTGEHIDFDPFADPTNSDNGHHFVEDSTLSVGRNASLTLGTDSLIVLGRALHHAIKIAILTHV